MPIRASERARYPKDWKAISTRIRERAGNKCEECGVPNGERIKRRIGDEETWITEAEAFHRVARGDFDEAEARRWRAPIRVVLTVAHLDHTPENVAETNLRALCQLHHLRLDAAHHQQNARATRRARKAAGELFAQPERTPTP